jgi:hypothetical protein
MAAAINLANVQRTSGLIEKALNLAQYTTDQYPGVYGEDHPFNDGCAGNLALLHRVTGNPA